MTREERRHKIKRHRFAAGLTLGLLFLLLISIIFVMGGKSARSGQVEHLYSNEGSKNEVLESIETDKSSNTPLGTAPEPTNGSYLSVKTSESTKKTDICLVHTSTNDDFNCVICGEYIGPRYGFTDDDVYILAQLLCGDKDTDGDGEYDFAGAELYDVAYELNYSQISLVLCVVMNRVRSDCYADTVEEVVLQPGQFVVFPKNLSANPSDLAIEKVREWCEAYDRWDPCIQSIPENHLYFSSSGKLTNVSRMTWR